MYDLVRIFKQALAALASSFGGTWAALAGLAGALNVDLAAGKQIVFAAIAAAIASASAGLGNLVKQWRERAASIVDRGSGEAAGLLGEAAGLLDEARRILDR
jgi:hypothetical protein